MTLIQQIQKAALDPSVEVPDLLRQCKVLAVRLKHTEFGSWLSNELNGYPKKDGIPDYRQIGVQSRGDFRGDFGSGLKNAPLPTSLLPAHIRKMATSHTFAEPVSALCERLMQEKGDFQAPWPADIVGFCQHNVPMISDMTLLHAWKVITRSQVRGILDTIRTRTLDFVLAIEEEAPGAGDVAPGSPPAVPIEKVTNLYYTHIQNHGTVGALGLNARVSGGVSFSSGLDVEQRTQIEGLLSELRTQIATLQAVAREDATEALTKVESELASAAPDASRIDRYLSLLANLATIAAPTAEMLKELIIRLLHR